MVISAQIRSAWQYAVAVLVPAIIAMAWPWSMSHYPFPASVFFLCIAVVARFWGFGPALCCTAASALAFWRVTLEALEYPSHVRIMRVLLFLVASIVLVSVSRQRSKEAREAEDRYRGVFDTALDAILFIDDDLRYIDANPAATRLLGYSREEVIGSRIGDFSSAEQRPKTIEWVSSIIAEKNGSGEAVIVRKDGIAREIEFRSVSNVRPGFHFVMMRDITSRKEAERSLLQLSGRLLRLQDEERQRIARELHDTTAQSLAAIRLNLTIISRAPVASSGPLREAIDECVTLTEQSIAEIRTLSYLLHPPMIEEAGLLPSLRWLVRGFEQRSGIAATLDAPSEFGRLPLELETAVFRIVQEALTNIQRHSGSTIAKIHVDRDAQSLHLIVEDEGRGMAGEHRDEPNALRGLGIAGMHERVRELGGQIEIQSRDRGTRVVVRLPLPEDSQ